MIDWKKMKEDLSKGIKDGAETVAKKASEVSAEGQRKVKIFNLKRKIQDHLADLGAAMYDVEKATPGTVKDSGAKGILKKIDQANAELKVLEEKS